MHEFAAAACAAALGALSINPAAIEALISQHDIRGPIDICPYFA
jgi:hypothetical protein